MRAFTSFIRPLRSLMCALGLLAFVHAASAADTAQQQQAAIEAAIQAMQAAQVKGPSDIKLRDQATLKLPAGYVWIPEPAAGQYMKAMGNHPDDRELGLIFPQADNENWVIVAEYEPAGYIKDDDAKKWDVDEMFKSLKEGTEAANEERRGQGFPELEIVGWVEKPAYAADTHRLIWSMSARHKGAAADEPMSINYNTYALGREGYISLNLITQLKDIARDKQHAQVMLSAMQHEDGKRYADFNASTDKVAEYGLAALVGGLAAKKLGMFALMAGVLAKFGKVLLLGAAALGGVATKFFKKKQA
ncbi:MAG: DUF2167 domain-containing protein [Aquabacterium sp.]